MKRQLSQEERETISGEIRQFLAEEFEIDPAEISDSTNIVDDLGGDSILFMEMIEEFKEKYDIDLEIRTIGMYMLKNPIYTFGETLNAIFEIIEKGEDLIEEIEAGEQSVAR
jgi:acyl carrier protein